MAVRPSLGRWRFSNWDGMEKGLWPIARWVDLVGLTSIAGVLAGVWLADPKAGPAASEGNVQWLTDGRAALVVKEGESWYRAEMNGVPIGYATVTTNRLGDDLLITQQSRLFLNVMNQQQRVDTLSRAVIDEQQMLKRFEFNIEALASQFSVLGKVKDDNIDLWFRSSTGETSQRVHLSSPPVLDLNLPRLAAARGFSPGQKYKVNVFDPATLGQRETEIRVVAKEIIDVDGAKQAAWHLVQKYGDLSVSEWVDDNGEALVAEAPLGFRLIRTSSRVAELEFGKGAPDVIRLSSIAPDRPLTRIEGLQRLTLRLTDASLAGLQIDGGNQVLRGNEVEIHRVAPVEAGAAQISLDLADTSVAQALLPEPLIQSAAPEMIAVANEIAAGETRPVELARQINAWVHRNLRQQNVIGVPSALEVLKNRVGDCNEHAALYVALARALHLPARVSAGLIYLEAFGRFYYHAWPEVYVGQWLPVDPVFEQFPADATHLRLVSGSLDRQMVILQLLGRLQIKVVDEQHDDTSDDGG